MVPIFVLWYVVVLLFLARRYSPEIYDFIIVSMTSVWYKEVLTRLPARARVLDIGIGTGTALSKNAEIVCEKELKIVGVDYEQAYVTKCESVVKDTPGLTGRVTVVCKSVYDEDLLQAANSTAEVAATELFDAVYFSGSISLMPDPAEALRCTARLLKPDGAIYITQTFQRRGTKVFEVMKPLLKYLTTIDFGKLTYESDVDEFIAKSGLVETPKRMVIPNSKDNYFQAAFIITLRRPEDVKLE